MNSVEFHKINDTFYKFLSDYNFKKGKRKSTWYRSVNDSLQIELEIRIDRDGWNPYFGSSFVYGLLPIFNGREIYPAARQFRLCELKSFDPSLIKTAQELLNAFATKLPRYEGCNADEYYIYLKGSWTENKVLKYEGGWCYFYDEIDLLGWHNATQKALLTAVDDLQEHYSEMNFNNKPKKSDNIQKTQIIRNNETGEFEVIENRKPFNDRSESEENEIHQCLAESQSRLGIGPIQMRMKKYKVFEKKKTLSQHSISKKVTIRKCANR